MKVKKQYKTFYLFFVGILFINISTVSSAGIGSDSTFYSAELRYHYGIVLPHHTIMTYLINDYSRGFEFNLIRKRYKSDSWESYSSFPETGLGFWYSTFGESEIYGEGFAVYPYVNFKIFDLGKFSAKYRVALGLGYASKPFKVGKNTYNTVFGSHLNAYIGFGLLTTYPLTSKWMLSTSLSLSHMSNGSTRKPNNGINVATVSFGAIYNFSSHPEPEIKKISPPPVKGREFIIMSSAGRNQPAPYNTMRYWSGSINLTHLWHRTKLKSYGITLDMLHYGGSAYAFIDFESIDEDKKYGFSDFLYAGIYGSMESHLNSTTLYIATGMYLHYKTKPKQPVYARLGVKQHFSDRWLGHFGIKANFFTAEFIEFGLGYKFKYKK